MKIRRKLVLLYVCSVGLRLFFLSFFFFPQGYDCIQMIDGKAITFTSAHTCFFYAAFMFVALLFQVLFRILRSALLLLLLLSIVSTEVNLTCLFFFCRRALLKGEKRQ